MLESVLSTERLTFFIGVGAIVVTLGVGTCSTNARFNDVNARIGELRTDLRGINTWIRDHATGHPSAGASRTAPAGHDFASDPVNTVVHGSPSDLLQDDGETITRLRAAVEAGNTNAQNDLGVLYAYGHGVPQDYREAVRLFRLSSEQGNTDGQNNLGILYRDGLGVPQNYAEAVKLLGLAAEQGNSHGRYNLGVMYRDGRGVPQDYRETVRLFQLAAEQGNATAQNALGAMYADGWGVPQDYGEAVKWFRLAAEQGNADGQNSLGVMCRDGRGMPQDYICAHMWLNLAAAQGTRRRPSSARCSCHGDDRRADRGCSGSRAGRVPIVRSGELTGASTRSATTVELRQLAKDFVANWPNAVQLPSRHSSTRTAARNSIRCAA